MFIDNKGRLFGKVNIIDFLALIFLISLIPMIWLGNRIYKKPMPVVEYEGLKKQIEEARQSREKVNALKEIECQEKIKCQDKIKNFLRKHKKYRRDLDG